MRPGLSVCALACAYLGLAYALALPLRETHAEAQPMPPISQEARALVSCLNGQRIRLDDESYLTCRVHRSARPTMKRELR